MGDSKTSSIIDSFHTDLNEADKKPENKLECDNEEKISESMSPSKSSNFRKNKKISVGVQYVFPFVLHSFITEISEKYENRIVTWTDDGKSFNIDRNHQQLPALLQSYFGHDKYESLRRQLNIYGFKVNNLGNFERQGSNLFHRASTKENLLKIKPRPKPSRVKSTEQKFSNEEILSTEGRRPQSARVNAGERTNFPRQLHALVSTISQIHPDIVSWAKNGASFFINDTVPDIHDVLYSFSSYYDLSTLIQNFASYGFKRRTLTGHYFHPLFSRDDPDKCDTIYPERKRSLIDSNSTVLEKVTGTQMASICSVNDGVGVNASDKSDMHMSEYDSDLSTYAALKDDELDVEVDFGLSSDIEDNNIPQEGNYDSENMDSASYPESNFKVLQRVYATDKDGLLYEAVIRRQLYGPQYHRQVEMGLVGSQKEADLLLKKTEEQDPRPMWHYFVHYNNWNVNFDRWVPEYAIYDKTDKVKEFADRLRQEHKALQHEMRSHQKGKKSYQTVNGVLFLREWKIRMLKVTQELNFQHSDMHLNISENLGAKEPVLDEIQSELSGNLVEIEATALVGGANGSQNIWSKAALITEKALRDKSLATKRKSSEANSIVLPFALKKIMVESWEIINQCHMMPALPAQVTIREALGMYLVSKNVNTQITTTEASNETTIDEGSEDKIQQVDSRNLEWRDMGDGIAMLFDEALPSHLLYREEIPQLRTLLDCPEYADKSYSDIYGCEHLLRLFVRLPTMLSDTIEDKDTRTILAKVNDFVRFLLKNESTIFIQSHRKLNESELREQQKILKTNEKRKSTTKGSSDDGQLIRKKAKT